MFNWTATATYTSASITPIAMKLSVDGLETMTYTDLTGTPGQEPPGLPCSGKLRAAPASQWPGYPVGGGLGQDEGQVYSDAPLGISPATYLAVTGGNGGCKVVFLSENNQFPDPRLWEINSPLYHPAATAMLTFSRSQTADAKTFSYTVNHGSYAPGKARWTFYLRNHVGYQVTQR